MDNVTLFLNHLDKERRFRPRSLKDYRLGLAIFLKEADPLELKTYAEFSRIIVKIKDERKWEDRTTYKLVCQISEYLKWAKRSGLILKSVLDDGHTFKKNAKSTNIEWFDWDDPEFKKLFNSPHMSIRNKVLFHVLKSSGIRASEAVNLKIEDVKGRWLNIQEGKGGEQRNAPIDEETRYWINVYMKCLQDHYKGPWLFPREDFSGPMKSDSLWKMMNRLGRKTGLHIYPHKFRHSLAGAILKRGGSIHTASTILGHKSISTTADIYTHLSKEDVLKQYDDALKSF